MPTTYRVTLGAIVLATGLVTPSNAQGQPICKDPETVFQCWMRLQPGDAATKKVQEKAGETQVAKKSETGLTDLAGFSSSVKDFLPILQMSGVLGAVDTDEKTGVVSIALNTPFFGSASADGDVHKTLQLRATIESKAKLYEPLEQKLPSAGRADLVKQLLGAKKDAQHLTLHATYNVSSSWLGRSFARHARVLGALSEVALAPPGDGNIDAEARFIKVAGQLLVAVEGNLMTDKWQNLSAEDWAAVERLLPALVRQEALADAEFDAQWKASGLDVYGQLILNQPQLQFAGSRTFRDGLFGPDLTTARVSFEMGIGNSLNAALGEFRNSCSDRNAECLKAFTAFTRRPGTRAAIKAGTRLAAFLEVVHNKAYEFSSTEPVLALTHPAGTGWTFGIDAGRLIGVDDAGIAAGRIDAALKWESPGDKTKDGRLVASLTVTKKVGEVSVPFSLVYANKAKDLTGVDYGLSANVGLKFDLFGSAK